MRIKEQPFSKNDVYSESVCVINGQQYKRIYAYNDVIIGNDKYAYFINRSSIICVNRCTSKGHIAYKHLSGFVDSSKTKYGQLRIKLISLNKVVSISLARLIAVNHFLDVCGRVAVCFKDGNRHNVDVNNLQLITSSDFANKRRAKTPSTTTIDGKLMYDTKIPHLKLYINDDVRLYSTKSCKFLKLAKDKDGYLYTTFNGKYVYVHKLVYETFYYIDDVGVVDHMDGNNTNNHPDNLQMVPRGINSSFFFINRCKPREFRETPQNCGQS